METEIRLSFVIPAYNIEGYIEECVDSLEYLPINKEEFEIIIVNDGSLDGTLGKCEFLKLKYKNIKLLSINNAGVSNARNQGITLSKGKYICFVDGDDFHVNDGIVEMLEKSEELDLDIIRGKYFIFKNGEYIKNNENDLPFYNKNITGLDFLLSTIKNKEVEVVPWLGLFKREFLQKNRIVFDKTISYEEDQIFFLDCLATPSCSVMQTNIYFYAYRYRESSVTKKPTLRQAQDVVKVVALEEEIAKLPENKKYRKYMRKYQSASFYQLTSIYGRVSKDEKKAINKLVPFKTKTRCMFNSYNGHQFVKIFLFTFFRWVVDIVYLWRLK